MWTSLIFGFLILIVLLIFITQNTESTSFTFITWHWNLPLGVAILLAAVGGGDHRPGERCPDVPVAARGEEPARTEALADLRPVTRQQIPDVLDTVDSRH